MVGYYKQNTIDGWILQAYCVLSHLKMNHQTGRAIQVCSSVVFKFCSSEDCDREENDEESHSDAEESSGITTATNSSTGKAGVVLLLVIIVFKGEGSEWVICSISKLMELACGKCQEVNCAKT